jgi:mannose-6-phosphate isomerase-like protein (cupin superfamily)
MRVFRTKKFVGDRPWQALDVANMSGITSRIHWTNEPYRWHINDGEEVFAVLDGCIEMKYHQQGVEKSITLNAGDVFFAEAGCEHVAHPQGEARILVIEKAGSV